MSTNSRARVHVLERVLANSGHYQVDAVEMPDGGRSVVAFDPRIGRAYVLVDDAASAIVDEELLSELQWAQRLTDTIPQDELPASAPDDAPRTAGTHGQYAHLNLESALVFGWDSPHNGPARRLLPEVVVDMTTGVIVDWNVSPGKAGGKQPGSHRSLDIVALAEGVTPFDVVPGHTKLRDVAAAIIDYKTGNARLRGAQELFELSGAPVVRLARGGQLDQQLADAVNLIGPPEHVARVGAATAVAERHTGLTPEARAALLDGDVHYAVSNVHRQNGVFGTALFSRGYVAFDVLSGGFLSSVHEFNMARQNFAIQGGQRGFASIGSMTFSIVSIGGLVYAAKDIDSFGEAVDFVVGNAVIGAGAFLIGRLAGSAVIGGIGGLLLTMENDSGGGPSEDDLKREQVAAFLHRFFSKEEIEEGGDALREAVDDFLFETLPMVLEDGPTDDGSQVSRLSFSIIDFLDAHDEAEATNSLLPSHKPAVAALINVLRLEGGLKMQDMLQQKWHVSGGTYYDRLLGWLEGEGLEGFHEHLPPPEIESTPEHEPPSMLPDGVWAIPGPDGTWVTRADEQTTADHQDDRDEETSAPSSPVPEVAPILPDGAEAVCEPDTTSDEGPTPSAAGPSPIVLPLPDSTVSHPGDEELRTDLGAVARWLMDLLPDGTTSSTDEVAGDDPDQTSPGPNPTGTGGEESVPVDDGSQQQTLDDGADGAVVLDLPGAP